MPTSISLPDQCSLNEIRILGESLSNIEVWEVEFENEDRSNLTRAFRRNQYVILGGGEGRSFIVPTNIVPEKEIEDLLIIGPSLTIQRRNFSNFPIETSRRLLFAFLQACADRVEIYKGDGWQFFSLQPSFGNAYEAIDIEIHVERDYYSIFFDPTLLFLLPLKSISLTPADKDRGLIRIVPVGQETILKEWGHSSHAGWLGLLSGIEVNGIEAPLNGFVTPQTAILVKNTRKAKDLKSYPALALRVIARKNEIDGLGLSKQQRERFQPLSMSRFELTRRWVNNLLNQGTGIQLNKLWIPIETRLDTFSMPVIYPRNSVGKAFWYPEPDLLFDPDGNQKSPSQTKGLATYGPFDQKSNQRPFESIRPFLIVPNSSNYRQKAARLFKFLKEGYKKRETYPSDDEFPGISNKKPFNVNFEYPDKVEDVFECDLTLESYLEAAKKVLQRWFINDNGSGDRIAIVVVPDKYGRDADEDEDPYVDIKKLFVENGLPSQMIEIGTLRGVEDQTIPFGHLLWTFALDLYVKLGGKPWTLFRPLGNVNCLIGIGFGRDMKESKTPIYMGVANIFDNGGQWLSFTSDNERLNSDDMNSFANKEFDIAGTNSFKIQEELTRKIILESLRKYSNYSSQEVPVTVVLHKNGRIYEPEALGFLEALSRVLRDAGVGVTNARFGLVSLYKNHNMRMYGPDYPVEKDRLRRVVSRGSMLILSENKALLATTGKSHFTYGGIGTPYPLWIERYIPSAQTLGQTEFKQSQIYSIAELSEHIFALTRLHWGSTRNIRLPITSEYAQRIARFVAKSNIQVSKLLQLRNPWWI